MGIYTPETAAHYIGTNSLLLSPYRGEELRRVGRFLCAVVERNLESQKWATETHNIIFPKVLSGVSPLPEPPVTTLAVEYLYGLTLARLTESDSDKRQQLYNKISTLERRLYENIIQKPSLNDLCLTSLRLATFFYLSAAANFMYGKEKKHDRMLKFQLNQAHRRYRQLGEIFGKLETVPEITTAFEEYIIQSGLPQAQDRTEFRKIYQELKQGGNAEFEILDKVLKAQKQMLSYTLRVLLTGLPTAKHHYVGRVKDIFRRRKEIRKNDPGFSSLWQEISDQFIYQKKYTGALHQLTLLGRMRCYALQGRSNKIKQVGSRLERVLGNPVIVPLENLAASAQRIEYEAQEKETRFGKSHPFVPDCPEQAVRKVEQFISAYERSPSALIMKSPFFGEQECWRIVRIPEQRAA